MKGADVNMWQNFGGNGRGRILRGKEGEPAWLIIQGEGKRVKKRREKT